MVKSLLFAILLVLLLNLALADEGDTLADGDTGIAKSRVKRQNIFQQILDLLRLIVANQMTILASLNTPTIPTPAAPTAAPPTPPAALGPYIDCTDIYNRGSVAVTGRQNITPRDGLGDIIALCDMETVGGGWTVIQSRQISADNEGINSNFYRSWEEYSSGFGLVGQSSDFWLGLEKIYRLTKQGTYELRIELESKDGRKGIAMYQPFSIGALSTNYALYIGSYTGAPAGSLAAGDSLSYHNNHPFSTKDRDNDGDANFQCAATYSYGGWWYIPRKCYYADLNGYGSWYTFDGWNKLKSSRMMIRRVS